jgi:hypothetical protein
LSAELVGISGHIKMILQILSSFHYPCSLVDRRRCPGVVAFGRGR